jgi:hypothetical protein
MHGFCSFCNSRFEFQQGVKCALLDLFAQTNTRGSRTVAPFCDSVVIYAIMGRLDAPAGGASHSFGGCLRAWSLMTCFLVPAIKAGGSVKINNPVFAPNNNQQTMLEARRTVALRPCSLEA